MISRFTFWVCWMLICCFSVGCAQVETHSSVEEESFKPDYVAHFPRMIIPEDNPMTPEKIKLGQRLFFDPNLSSDSTISCASCHNPKLAFADSLALSKGVNGRTANRNAPSLINVAFHPHFMREGGPKSLELQSLVPLESEDEMGTSIRKACERLNDDENYLSLFREAFDTVATPFTVTRALAAYERTLLGGKAPFDAYLASDTNALTARERRGYRLFQSERLGCASCHSGPLLTSFGFENNGTYANYTDNGRYKLTLRKEDIGKFKVPSLRNVSVTPPYMFDGSFATLESVLEHYESGGKSHVNKSVAVRGFDLSNEEREAILSFLHSLTDTVF